MPTCHKCKLFKKRTHFNSLSSSKRQCSTCEKKQYSYLTQEERKKYVKMSLRKSDTEV